jgi:hypothetical protein
LHVHDGGRAHKSPLVIPGPQVAVSPGLHVIAHDAQAPTAGALHDAPVSAFLSLSFFAACARLRVCSSAEAGLPATKSAATTAMIRDRIMCPPVDQ